MTESLDREENTPIDMRYYSLASLIPLMVVLTLIWVIQKKQESE